MNHIDSFQWNIQGKAVAKRGHELTLGSSAHNLCFTVVSAEDMSPGVYLVQ